jgi:phosphoadenosine phosphosulfate reductase
VTGSNISAILEKKIKDSKRIARQAFETYHVGDLAIAWTGGKDSTLVLWLIREVCKEDKRPLPECFCIDEGDMFDEVKEFLEKFVNEWGVKLEFLHNKDVSRAADGVLGATVRISDLNPRNQREIQRLGYEEVDFPYEPESFVGNHLMKTVVLNEYLEHRGTKAFFEGIRWDEQASRADEEYFSPRNGTEFSPEHVRICPILHFTERDVWNATFAFDIPVCQLYKEGYRSLGARVTTTKASELPAWEQDLENTDERSGRRQDKEHLMKKLRSLGYM